MQTNLLAPTFIDTDLIYGRAGLMRELGTKVGEVADVVDAAVRCVCDNEINGE